ncbi:hypothetical protein D3C87_1475200 [compost metagenome]
MVEPERADGFLDRVRRRDNLGLKDLVQAAGQAGWREASTRGLRALDCALYKVSMGEIDPRTLLRRFDLPVTPNAVGVEPARGCHG